MDFAEKVERQGKLIAEDVTNFRLCLMNGRTYGLEITGDDMPRFRRLQVSKMSKQTYDEIVQDIRGYD